MFLRKLAGTGGAIPNPAEFRSATLAASGSIAWPAGTIAGDFSLYYWSGSSNQITESQVNPGNDWVLLHEQLNSSRRSWLYGKILTSSDLSSNIVAPTATGIRSQIHSYNIFGATNFIKRESNGLNGANTIIQTTLSQQKCSLAATFRNIITPQNNLSVDPSDNWILNVTNSNNQYAYNTFGQIPQTLIDSGNPSVNTATWLTAVTISVS